MHATSTVSNGHVTAVVVFSENGMMGAITMAQNGADGPTTVNVSLAGHAVATWAIHEHGMRTPGNCSTVGPAIWSATAAANGVVVAADLTLVAWDVGYNTKSIVLTTDAGDDVCADVVLRTPGTPCQPLLGSDGPHHEEHSYGQCLGAVGDVCTFDCGTGYEIDCEADTNCVSNGLVCEGDCSSVGSGGQKFVCGEKGTWIGHGSVARHACADKNECDSSPCQNNATCADSTTTPADATDPDHVGVDDYRCTCLPGFNGIDCAATQDFCDSSPCDNGAACDSAWVGFRCSCAAGYAGATCADEVLG